MNIRWRTQGRGLLALAFALWVCAPGFAQGRFAGWDEVRDPAWRFDPDDRPVFGFSVPGSVAARTTLDAAEEALARRDYETAGRLLVGLLGDHPNDAIQVSGTAPWHRWVGAGEWALYRLETAVPAEVRAGLARPEQRAVLLNAARWRDEATLARLSHVLEGLPEGERALGFLSRLRAERGEWDQARFAATRAAAGQGITGESAATAGALLASLPEPVGRGPLGAPSLPGALHPRWVTTLTIHEIYLHLYDKRRLDPRGGKAINPFLAREERHEAPIAPIVPVVDDGVVFVADSISVTALDLRSGRKIWHHAGPMEEITLSPQATPWFDLGIYARTRRDRAIAPNQHAAPTVTADLVIASVQVPEPRREQELREFEGIPINWPLPRRRLVALDRRTGEVVWHQERPHRHDADFVNSFDVAGPPVVHGGTVFVAGSVTEGAINAYAAAFDLATGDLLWNTLVCSGQQELTMFNRPFQEHVVSPVALEQGDLFLSTNLGVVACVDAWSGRLRWLAGYEATGRNASMSPGATRRRSVFWTNHPPFTRGDTLFVTPLDSRFMLQLSRQTGRLVADPVDSQSRSDYRNHVEPAGPGRFVISGSETLEAYDAHTNRRVWDTPAILDDENEIIGPVTYSGGLLFAPTRNGLLVVDAASGQPTDPAGVRPWKSHGARRVVPAGSVLVSTDNGLLFAALDVENELSRIDSATSSPLAKNLEKAELYLIDGRLEEAQALFESAVHTEDPRYVARVRTGRLETALRLARRDGDAESWDRLLRVAQQTNALLDHAAEALRALHANNRPDAELVLDAWFAELAESHAHTVLELGELTPEGAAPLGLVDALRWLPREGPEGRIRRLQGIIAAHPSAPWQGGPAWAEAARRIEALIAEHGREIYAEYEDIARQAWDLVRDSTEDSRVFVELRFPNARVIADARAERLSQRLADGRAREVFEELGRIVAGERHLTLRAEAARALGETRFAARLDGVVDAASAGDHVPRIPGPAATTSVIEIHDRYRVSFPVVSGRPTARDAGALLGAVNVAGELFLLDTRTGRIRWRRPMPGGVTYARARDVDFHIDGERLHARCGNMLTCLDLADGHELWSTPLSGSPVDMVSSSGVVHVLTYEDDAIYVTGFGSASGAVASRARVPDCLDARMMAAGGLPVVFARNNEAADLHALDVVTGDFAARATVPEELTTLVRTFADPPVVMLSGRVTGGSYLGGWDMRTGEQVWEATTDPHTVSERNVWRTAAGGLVLVDPPIAHTEQGVPVELTPIDALRGLGERTESGPALSPVGPARDDALQQLVFAQPDLPGRLLLVNPADGQIERTLDLDPPAEGYVQVLAGRDGFVLVSETPDAETAVVMWVVRVGHDPQRYSIAVDALRGNGLSELTLVDGAVLVAQGGTVAFLRSDG